MEQRIDLGEALETILMQLDELMKGTVDHNTVLFCKNLQDNHIWLDTYISYEMCQFIMKWLLTVDEDPKLRDTPIYIHIMSGGGDLDVMFTLYDIIKNMRRPVITINEARAHSAAFIIYLAGDTRLMRPYSVFIAHEGSAELSGTHKEVEQATMAYNDRVQKMREIITSETNITMEQLKEHFDGKSDWHINYEQAKEYGILKTAMYTPSFADPFGNLLPLPEQPLTLPGYADGLT